MSGSETFTVCALPHVLGCGNVAVMLNIGLLNPVGFIQPVADSIAHVDHRWLGGIQDSLQFFRVIGRVAGYSITGAGENDRFGSPKRVPVRQIFSNGGFGSVVPLHRIGHIADMPDKISQARSQYGDQKRNDNNAKDFHQVMVQERGVCRRSSGQTL